MLSVPDTDGLYPCTAWASDVSHSWKVTSPWRAASCAHVTWRQHADSEEMPIDTAVQKLMHLINPDTSWRFRQSANDFWNLKEKSCMGLSFSIVKAVTAHRLNKQRSSWYFKMGIPLFWKIDAMCLEIRLILDKTSGTGAVAQKDLSALWDWSWRHTSSIKTTDGSFDFSSYICIFSTQSSRALNDSNCDLYQDDALPDPGFKVRTLYLHTELCDPCSSLLVSSSVPRSPQYIITCGKEECSNRWNATTHN